jgi:tetratricopeptide (TPR) repeat protein
VPPYDHHFQQDYVDFFNNGGIASALPASWQPEYVLDLTNDGMPEYIIRTRDDNFILGCQSGKYQIMLDVRAEIRIPDVLDANQNGFPEVILLKTDILEWDTSSVHAFPYTNWNEVHFRSLLVPQDRKVNINGVYEDPYGRADFTFEAMDLDPLLELAIHLTPPYFEDIYADGFPWRNETDYYRWNGTSYVFAKQIYDPPLFRFQAVHDGDWAFLRGEYDRAIEFYQQAIKDDNLFWYTDARRYYLLMNDPGWNGSVASPAKPKIDPQEYPNLTAYSYFRMLLAEIKKGYPSHAQTIYNWLQSNYPAGMPGYVYVELATLFWTEYQKSGDFGLSCSATYVFASTHPQEIFRYLATQIVSNKKLITWPDPINFGYQSAELDYSPAMICPSQ